MGATGEGVNFFQDAVGDGVGAKSAVGGDQVGQAGVAEEISGGILGVSDTVGVKYHDVALIQDIAPLIVSRFLKHPQREASQHDAFAAAAVIEERFFLSGIGNPQFVATAVPGGEAESHEAAFDAALAEKSVDGVQHFGGAMLLRTQASQRADRYGAIKSRGASLPADVSHGDG